MRHPVVLLEEYGDSVVSYPKERWALGDKKTLKAVFESVRRTDLTGSTATLTLYNSAGSSVATPAVTVTISTAPGKYRASCEATINAGAGGDLTAAGSYTAILTFNVANASTLKRAIRIPLDVIAAP